MILEDVLETIDRCALGVVVSLDEVAAALTGGHLGPGVAPSDRWHGLLEKQTGDLDPDGAVTRGTADRMLVMTAMFLTVEAGDVQECLSGSPPDPDPDGDRVLIRASAVAAQAGAAARALLDLVERGRQDVAAPGEPAEPSSTTELTARGVSGLSGADLIADHVLARQIEPPLRHLPDVRGRTRLVADLVGLLDDPNGQIQVLVGHGGAGKSTVALEVARQARDRGLFVWWVCARDANQLVRGMLAVATQLGATVDERSEIQGSSPDRGVDLLWERLDAATTPWLLVLDDAESPEVLGLDLAPGADHATWVRPSTGGTVVITTRVGQQRAWGSHASLHLVGDLEADDGADVVLDGMGLVGERRAAHFAVARDLAGRLGGVPLALSNTGSYLRSGVRHTAASLVAELPPSDDSRSYVHPHARVGPTWRLALDGLEEGHSPGARSLLAVLSYYAPERTVADDVLDGAELARCGLGPVDDTSAHKWTAALEGLVAVGLIRRTVTVGQEARGVTVHPQIAEVTLDDMSGPAAHDRLESAAVRLLRQAAERRDPGKPRDWPDLHRLEPHVYSLIDRMRTEDWRPRADALQLANRVAKSLVRAGLFVLGEKLTRHAQLHTVRFLQQDNGSYLDSEHTLAWALGLRGQILEAEERFRHLLADRIAVSGPTDPATLAVRDSLAWMLAEQGRLTEAHQLLVELQPDQQRQLGSHAQATMATRHRLGWIEALLGHLESAEINLRSVLVERREVLGDNHMDVFGTRYRLAWVIGLRGRAEEAEGMFRQLAEDLSALLDAEHPTTLMARARVAWALALRGQLTAAAQEYRDTLAIREKVMGTAHPRTLAARHDLACVLTQQGTHDEAERLLRGVLTDRTQLLGSENIRTLATRIRLAELLADRGRLVEAERRFRRLIRQAQATNRTDHPRALATRYQLGFVLFRRGRLELAEREFVALLGDQQRTFGSLHRATLATRDGLAMVLGARGLLTEATLQLRHVLADRTTVLGPQDPDTLRSRDHLARVLAEAGCLDEAETSYLLLLGDRAALLEQTHPDVLGTRYRIGWLAHLSDHASEAVGIYRAVLVDQEGRLGPRHPHTLRTHGGLARALLAVGDVEAADTIARDLENAQRSVLDHDHPDALHTAVTRVLVDAAGRYPGKAAAALCDQLAAQEKALGMEHPLSLSTREHLGWVHIAQNRSEEAMHVWGKLEQDCESILGRQHPLTIRLNQRMAIGRDRQTPPPLA